MIKPIEADTRIKCQIINSISKLGFSPKNGKNNVYYKKYNQYEICIEYNPENPKKSIINYGKDIICNRKTTCNFSQNESFVILECVDRLLKKGYKPKDIILEKAFKAGHKDCFLDILVKKENKSYLMIECKTYGQEYEKEKNNIFCDGGQLLSYYNQDQNAKALCLYSSQIIDNGVQYRNDIIDTKELNGKNVQELYDSWDNTFYQKGIFEEKINAYNYKNIGLIYNDLKDLKDTDGGTIFNQFAEILRRHIVSDKTNAFNKMFNLFICKIQDEDDRWDNNEDLRFQYKSNDTYESFFDRLNSLYKKGNWNYIGIEVPDISQDDFNNLLKLADDKDENLKKVFKDLRYYKSSQEFSFKEVYNKETFEENAEIVKEVVKLLQGYKIKYSQKHQYLGDFFELLLNTGIKQEAGQFFTPIPIARFICKSLPIEQIIKNKNNAQDNHFLPYVIDYASGSGHFLTEIMDEIDTYVKDIKVENIKCSRNGKQDFEAIRNNLKWTKEYVYGIEKDYRLVKTSKVSSFLNGDGDANVMSADGLASFNDKKYKGILKTEEFQKSNQVFDILVANPPYSISAFRKTLKNGEKSFDLYKNLTDNSSEIECLFIERTAQLLKENGVAGIILPVSILTNGGIYEKTRQIILKNFDILAIQKFGDNAFMATGTKTVVLFMRRKSNLHYSNIEKLLDKFLNNYKDVTVNGIENAFSTYVNNVFEDINFEDYISILQDKPTEKAQKSEIYNEYRNYTNAKIIEIEKEKLIYFILTYPQKIVLSDSLEKEIEKDFYGYEFSNRKGHEGIHLYKDENGVLQSKLYNPLLLQDETKINNYILNNFNGVDIEQEINEIKADEEHPLNKHIDYVRLSDLMSFDLKTFDKQINLNSKKIQIESKYSFEKLDSLLSSIESGKRPSKVGTKRLVSGVPSLGGEHIGLDGKVNLNNMRYITQEYYDTMQQGHIRKSDILICKDGALTGKVAYVGNNYPYINSAINEHIFILRNNEKINQKYLFEFLYSHIGQNLLKYAIQGAGQGGLNRENLSNIKIPIPPLNIQEKIVEEINKLETKLTNYKKQIGLYNIEIKELIKQASGQQNILSEITTKIIDGSHNPPRKIYKKDFYMLSAINITNSGINLSVGCRYISAEDYEKENQRTQIKTNDILLSIVGSIGKSIIVDDNIGNITIQRSVAVIRPNLNIIEPKYLLAYVRSTLFQNKLQELSHGSQQQGVYLKQLKNIKIPVPNIKEQRKIVAKILPLEAEIEKLQKEIDAIPAKKQAILDKYLK